MSGRRPDSTRVYNFKTSFRESGIGVGQAGLEWSRCRRRSSKAGYLTVGMGKLYHPGHPNNNDCSHPEAAGGCPSWTTTFNTTAPANVTLENHGAHPVLTCVGAACDFRYVNPDAQIFFKENRTLINGTTVEAQPACAALADDKSTDEWLADAAVTTLRAPSPARRSPSSSVSAAASLPPLLAAAAALPRCVRRPAAAARRSAHCAEGRAGRRLLLV